MKKLTFEVRFWCDKKLDSFEREIIISMPTDSYINENEYKEDVDTLYSENDIFYNDCVAKIEARLRQKGFDPTDIESELLSVE